MKHLEGTWNVTALETEGNEIPAGMIGDSKIIVSGDRFTTVAMGASYGGRLSIDESVTPHTLDLMFDEGPHAGIASLAIYRMEGDSWTICLGFAGNQRPTEFKTTAGSGNALETLTKESKGNSATTKSKSAKPASAAVNASAAGVAILNNEIADALSKHSHEMLALSGEWAAQKLVMNGQPLADEYLKVGRRMVTGSELRVMMAGQVQVHSGFVVDPTQSPKHINYFDLKNPDKGFTQYGIYELNGDTLTTCMASKGKPRPALFESTKGDATTSSTWKKL